MGSFIIEFCDGSFSFVVHVPSSLYSSQVVRYLKFRLFLVAREDKILTVLRAELFLGCAQRTSWAELPVE